MIKTFYPTPTKKWKPTGIRTIGTPADNAPMTDVSNYDHLIRRIFEEYGIKGNLPQDERFDRSILAQYNMEWNSIHGRRV